MNKCNTNLLSVLRQKSVLTDLIENQDLIQLWIDSQHFWFDISLHSLADFRFVWRGDEVIQSVLTSTKTFERSLITALILLLQDLPSKITLTESYKTH